MDTGKNSEHTLAPYHAALTSQSDHGQSVQSDIDLKVGPNLLELVDLSYEYAEFSNLAHLTKNYTFRCCSFKSLGIFLGNRCQNSLNSDQLENLLLAAANLFIILTLSLSN